MVKIFLPDGSFKEFAQAPQALDVAQTIGARLAQDSVGVRVNKDPEIKDIRTLLLDQDHIELVTLRHEDSQEVIRHTTAHIMANAVQNIWPDIKVTIGPVIDDGFYYDFDSPRVFSEEDFNRIEQEMDKIIKANHPLVRDVWSIDQAIQTFLSKGEHFKAEIIKDLAAKGETQVSVYHQGPWFDLCRGPHLQTTGQVKAFKLMSVAGAYWRGDETRPMLQRIYATAFRDKKELESHLANLEEAKKRDHRKLGKELGLFHFHQWAPGSPFFTGKGAVIYNQLQVYLRELYLKYGYQEVITPQIFDVELFKQSGHYQNYRENMYFMQIDEREFSSKPMNCPSHCLLYKMQKFSYRDMPLRMADFGRLHRYEMAGALHGLNRVRTFCQDDGHIFCTLGQMQNEITGFMNLLNEVYQTLGMHEYRVFLSTRPENRMGSDQVWDQSEKALEEALKELGIDYKINPGDGAFYGPKLDIMFVDALKRTWQLGTLQLDFNLPHAFELSYTGDDDQQHRPVMLHRAILGSLERFIGVYLEHTAGHLPAWLAPVQVSLLNITDRVNSYCEQIKSEFMQLQIRCEFDQRNEKLNYKIREAQLAKIPYMLVIGDKEAADQTVTVRLRTGENLGTFTLQEALHLIQSEIKLRRLQVKLKEANH